MNLINDEERDEVLRKSKEHAKRFYDIAKAKCPLDIFAEAKRLAKAYWNLDLFNVMEDDQQERAAAFSLTEQYFLDFILADEPKTSVRRFEVAAREKH